MTTTRLTIEQRQLAQQHLGLVAVHLRRHVGGTWSGQIDREWDELFQEGCLGLIQAVATYRPERGIPFAAYALPRIHSAVSRALHRSHPAQRPGARHDDDDPAPQARAHVVHLRHDPAAPPSLQLAADAETIGQLIRARYDRAVRAAARRATRGRQGRPDRADLVERVVQQRLFVARDEHRTALRQLARDTRSSYARVVQCEQRLVDDIRQALGRDDELTDLCAEAQRCSDGVETVVDDDMARRFRAQRVRRFRSAFSGMSRAQRAATLLTLVERQTDRVADVATTMFRALPDRLHDGLLDEMVGNLPA